MGHGARANRAAKTALHKKLADAVRAQSRRAVATAERTAAGHEALQERTGLLQ